MFKSIEEDWAKYNTSLDCVHNKEDFYAGAAALFACVHAAESDEELQEVFNRIRRELVFFSMTIVVADLFNSAASHHDRWCTCPECLGE